MTSPTCSTGICTWIVIGLDEICWFLLLNSNSSSLSKRYAHTPPRAENTKHIMTIQRQFVVTKHTCNANNSCSYTHGCFPVFGHFVIWIGKKNQESEGLYFFCLFSNLNSKIIINQLCIKTKKPELAFFRSMILNLGLLLYVLSKKYLSKYNTENIQVSACSWEFFPKYFFSSKFSKVSWLTF